MMAGGGPGRFATLARIDLAGKRIAIQAAKNVHLRRLLGVYYKMRG